MKKTLIIGASPNPERYSYKAALALKKHNHQLVLFGIKKGHIDGMLINNVFPNDNDFDTISLYIGPDLQKEYYNSIIKLAPKRVIFNPGTENEEFYILLRENKIDYEEACTLVLLATDSF